MVDPWSRLSSSSPTSVPELPWPGDELVYRVSGAVDRDRFYASGKQSAEEIERVLGLVNRPMASFGQILDFGCGCARILLWLEKMASASSLHGVDIDARAIRWIQENLPYVTARVNEAEPPLDYPDGFFDLVYNHSVFTHISEAHQDQWLEELRRVTKPGGILVLSVHGEHAFRHFEEASLAGGGNPKSVRERFRRDGHVFLREDPWVGSAFPDWYHTSFHAPWYVFAHWSRYFKVVAYAPQASLGYQDFVVLERASDDVTTDADLGPMPSGEVAPSPVARGADRSVPSPARDVALGLVHAGPDVGSTTGFGALSRLSRHVVLRLLRHYDEHQRRVHEAILEAAAAGSVDGADPATGLTLKESNTRLWDALRRTGERISRLENDVWEVVPSSDRPAGSSDPGGADVRPD